MTGTAYRFCLAPMMKRTDKHMRYFFRLMSRRALLYTEMLNANALVMGARHDLLAHDIAEYPLACQLGGSDYRTMAEAAGLVGSFGYSEVNMNVGCPSSRVQNGDFGACLMRKPSVVSECLRAMSGQNVEITMKCRIGIDDDDSYDFLRDFIGEVVLRSGIERVIIHARIAKLDGLSPKENRVVPPLQYDRVYRLARDFPHVQIIMNGGIVDMDSGLSHFDNGVAGVMVGRAAVDKPFLFSDIDRRIFNDDKESLSRTAIFSEYLKYIERHYRTAPLFAILRPLNGLFYGIAGAKILRYKLSSMAIGDINFSMQALHNLCDNISKPAEPSNNLCGSVADDSDKAFRV